MRPQPIMIKLGNEAWRVRPLTLRQIQEIEPLLVAAETSTAGSVATAVQILAIALGRDHPEAAARVCDIEASVKEIGAAMSSILALGGFIPATEAVATMGEAGAGAD
jgi:hypothetical protein